MQPESRLNVGKFLFQLHVYTEYVIHVCYIHKSTFFVNKILHKKFPNTDCKKLTRINRHVRFTVKSYYLFDLGIQSTYYLSLHMAMALSRFFKTILNSLGG